MTPAGSTRAKWIHANVRIATGKGDAMRDAWMHVNAPGLAVTPHWGKLFTITHVGSGDRLPVSHVSRRKVQAAALLLASQFDWTCDVRLIRTGAGSRLALASLPVEVREQ